VQGIYAQNVGHTVPIQGYVGFLMCITWWNNADSLDNSAQDMKWFGLA
jgi:hypothetical protein